MSTTPVRDLTIVSRSPNGRPRTLRLGSRDAGFRRLAAVMLRLDVETLASDLRASRQERSLPRAA